MYPQTYFQENDTETLLQFLQSQRFVRLCAIVAGEIHSVRLPVEVVKEQDQWLLLGHMPLENPLAQAVQAGWQAVAYIDHPAHHYISASWYSKPIPPTWNYKSMEVKGKLSAISLDDLYAHLARLVKDFESTYSTNPWPLEALPEKAYQSMARQLIGFRLAIAEMKGQFKLSQNRNAQDFQEVIRQLQLIQSPMALGTAEIMLEQRARKKDSSPL